MNDPILVIEEPERVKARSRIAWRALGRIFKLTLERQEAVPEQGALLRTWEEAADAMQVVPSIGTWNSAGHGGDEAHPHRPFRRGERAKYVSRFKELGGDLKAWEEEGYLVLLMGAAKPGRTACKRL